MIPKLLPSAYKIISIPTVRSFSLSCNLSGIKKRLIITIIIVLLSLYLKIGALQLLKKERTENRRE